MGGRFRKALAQMGRALRPTLKFGGDKLYPQLYAKRLLYRRDLDPPPVPTVDATCDRLLDYARVIADDKQFAATKTLVEAFKSPGGGADEAQTALERIAIRKDNWINKFWMNDMYLANRIALPLNSNPAYVFPRQHFHTDEDRIEYAAALIRGLYSFKNMIDRRNLPQDVSTGREKVPLCMDQYWRLFTSYRQPALPKDKQHTHVNRRCGDNEHIVVMCRQQAFVIRTVIADEQLHMGDLIYQLREAERMSNNKSAALTIPVGAFTAADRDTAATTLNALLQHDVNRASFNWVETASFVLCLDVDVDGDVEGRAESDMNEREVELARDAHHILHGFGSKFNGLNRWYDKTQHMIITQHGCTGMLIEHSIAEGIVIINMVEQALKVANDKVHQAHLMAKAGEVGGRKLSPKPLTWHVGEGEREMLDKCSQYMEKASNNLQMNILIFEGYGKDSIKGFRCSPDAFMQLALQLTYYRSHGRLCSTYESAAIRRFKKGRVDNIRAAHSEALNWVQCMSDEKAEKLASFKMALEKQTKVMLENVSGFGIDNHLAALQQLSTDAAEEKGKGRPGLFDDHIFKEIMRFPLSTSQVTTNIPDTFLCYGPVSPDGYGVAYNLQTEQIIFAISAFNDCAWTNAVTFRRNLIETLNDMKHLLTQ